MTEIDPANLSLFYLISRQIGNMLRMYQMSREQKKMQQKLETLVREIEEKNEVLNFLSESDALTGCLNRRGFMEKAVQMNREYEGKEVVILFADLDHLKEINDCFGHIEGDFAHQAMCGGIEISSRKTEYHRKNRWRRILRNVSWKCEGWPEAQRTDPGGKFCI